MKLVFKIILAPREGRHAGFSGNLWIGALVQSKQIGDVTEIKTAHPAINDNFSSSTGLDQYYTRQDVAERLYSVFKEHFDPNLYQMVEPSAGTGSFLKLLPPGSLAYDVDPKYPGIQTADFLKIEIESDREIVIIGNPPFGKNASMAVRFFNRAARRANVIAFIVPRTFRKASIVNRLDRHFHLLREEPVPSNAFLFNSKPYNVPAVFQIWVRRRARREHWSVETKHPDFDFTTPVRAEFAVQRVGARAGRVHHDFTASPSSHYFISGNVERIMKQLDFASVTGNVAGNPSLSKAEIVWLYRQWIEGRSKFRTG